jgi:hypothetical protein
MATIKRNHTPNVEICRCTVCSQVESAPPGKRHRACKAKGGKWVGTGFKQMRQFNAAQPAQS